MALPPWAVRLVEQAEARYREYLQTKVDRPIALEDILEISKLSAIGRELYLGLDIGRRRDLSVLWLDDKIGSSLVARAVIPMARMPFYVQQKVLWTLLEHTPIRRACIDQTGIGAKLAEDAIDRFGAHRVEGIDFTAGNKEAMAGGLRTAMEDRLNAIPVDPAIRNSLHSIKRIQTTTGHFRYDAERSEQTGHADHFWAKALAVQAASTPGMVIEHASTGQGRVAAGAYEATGAGAGLTDGQFKRAGARRQAAQAAGRGPKGF